MGRKEEAQFVEIHGSLEHIVKILQACKGLGLNVYTEFKRKRLYSCDVTIDNAYETVYGVEQEEYRAQMDLIRRQNREEEKGL